MLHAVGGRHAGSGKAVRSGFARFLGTCWLPVCFGFQTGHFGFGLPFQLGNAFLQPLNDGLLSDDDANQNIPVGSPEIEPSQLYDITTAPKASHPAHQVPPIRLTNSEQ